MGKYEAVLFDLDGTLLNTIEDLADSVNDALEDYHCPKKSLEQIITYVGNGIRNLIKRSVEGGENHPEFENIFLAFQKHYKHNCKNKTKPYDGITELLRTLKEEGIKLGIVSNKAQYAVTELNEYYFKEFDITAIGEREGMARKPAPDMIYAALQEMGVSPKRVIYVGDSEVDIKTAANANIPCFSVLWGFRSREILLAQGAKYLAETAEELLHLLNNFDDVDNSFYGSAAEI